MMFGKDRTPLRKSEAGRGQSKRQNSKTKQKTRIHCIDASLDKDHTDSAWCGRTGKVENRMYGGESRILKRAWNTGVLELEVADL